jgi:hypothetical protein
MRIKLIRPLNSKLQFVKTIKTFSGMGLKESKDLCDDMHDNINVYYNINIEVSKKEEFIKEIKYHFNDGVVVNGSLQYERAAKMLELGIGEKMDYIDFIKDEIKTNILSDSEEILDMVLYKLSKEDIEEVFFKIRKEIE